MPGDEKPEKIPTLERIWITSPTIRAPGIPIGICQNKNHREESKT
jgi:hypothetical protein